MKTTYVKYVDDEGNYFYDLTLPTGEEFKKVPKSLGDYLHRLIPVGF